jgi:hypothetical protein
MKTVHPVGHSDLHVRYRVKPPTLLDLEDSVNKAPHEPNSNSLFLDLKDAAIRSQVQQFREKSWLVKIPTPPPLKPSDHEGTISRRFYCIYLIHRWSWRRVLMDIRPKRGQDRRRRWWIWRRRSRLAWDSVAFSGRWEEGSWDYEDSQRG